MQTSKPTSVEAYISAFPVTTQMLLNQIRETIKTAAPEAEESISYGMPAYKYKGPLVYFGAYEKHIGFYPTGEGMLAFAPKLSDYKTSKGAVQFQLNEPIPFDLIVEMVIHRMSVNNSKKK